MICLPKHIERPAMVRTVLLSAALLALGPPAFAAEVVVFAASSLKTALDQVAADWQAETGHTVLISYAGSGKLAKQIIDGAPADLFISAAEDWMDQVVQQGQIVDGSRIDLLSNRLVLVGQGAVAPVPVIGPDFDLAGLLAREKLSMAMVDSVPAGQYGKAALMTLGLWDDVQSQVVQRDNVRAALALVEVGEAGLGVVYATDAAASDRVAVVARFPDTSHPPIRYPAALLTHAQDDADRAFLDALSGPRARALFSAQGFVVLPTDAPAP